MPKCPPATAGQDREIGMTRAGGEPWVCGSCRSFNEIRSTRCYKCRTPRALVEADPSTLIVAGAGATEASAAVAQAASAAAVGGYRDSAARAGLTQCMVVATGILAVVASIAGADMIGNMLKGETDEARQDVGVVVALGWTLYGFAAVTLVSWAAWLSRVVDNVPKVGLGWPNVSPTAAFIENFLPGWNLLRVPAIVRDIIHRLEPANGRADALLVAAWLGLVGGVVLPRGGGIVIGVFADSVKQVLAVSVILGEAALGVTLAGLVFLILLIRRIESRMQAAAAATTTIDPSIKLQPAAEPAG
jgi:hypothetical protein